MDLDKLMEECALAVERGRCAAEGASLEILEEALAAGIPVSEASNKIVRAVFAIALAAAAED